MITNNTATPDRTFIDAGSVQTVTLDRKGDNSMSPFEKRLAEIEARRAQTVTITEPVVITATLSPFEKRLAELQARQAEEAATKESQLAEWMAQFADCVPEIDDEPSHRQLDRSLTDYIKALPAGVAIAKLTLKRPLPSRLRNETKFRCPWVEHTDNNPSACISTEKNVWTCYACMGGGDWLDLAAAAYGYTKAGQKISNDPDGFKRLLGELQVLLNWTEPEQPAGLTGLMRRPTTRPQGKQYVPRIGR